VRAIVASTATAHRAGRHRAHPQLGSDSALDTLLLRALVEHNQHHLLVTTRAFLDLLGLRDLADLPPLAAGR